MKARISSYILDFKQPAGTSRGVLRQKQSFFLHLYDEQGRYGLGEVGVLRGLSIDDRPELEAQLSWTAENIEQGLEALYEANREFPSIQFALEQAFSHIEHGFLHFDTPFSRAEAPVAINGLIWMGEEAFMVDQIRKRLNEGFRTLKMKVGAIDWAVEEKLLRSIRGQFRAEDLELRVDANGAFDLHSALKVGDVLRDLEVHSIEQPLPVNDRRGLAEVCARMTIPVALDESLIGVFDRHEKEALLDELRPQYIILKPSFIGGWRGSDEWIECAEQRNIGWWATSALESTVGMNAIAQWASTKELVLPQGLGTGSLYTNNIPAPLQVEGGLLKITGNVQHGWDLGSLK
ncbi:MAG: O-succinylbenzoate synthase [Bacteroidota bacterium]|jgi:o-succinylbenzoate synthase